MSFLPLLDDVDASTLAAVLSFIDGADGSAPDSVDAPSAALRAQEEVAAVKYTTQFQRKKRAEIVALREQAGSSRRAWHTCSSRELGPAGPVIALNELGKRLRAELANRRLKEAVKHYHQLEDAILSVLKKQEHPEDDYRILLDTPETPPYPTLTVNISAPMMDAIRQGMMRLLDESRSVFPMSPSSRITGSFETVRTSSGATAFVEIRTATPVEYSALQASNMIWRGLYTSGLRSYAHKRHLMIPSRDGLSMEKKFVMMVSSPVEKHPLANELGVRLTGMHLVQRYVPYPDGTTIVVTSAVVVFPPHGRVFREHKWMKVSPLSSNSSQSTAVVETCYRVYPGERNDPRGLDSEDPDAAFYLRALSANTRLVMQRDQNAQLEGEMFCQAPPRGHCDSLL